MRRVSLTLRYTTMRRVSLTLRYTLGCIYTTLRYTLGCIYTTLRYTTVGRLHPKVYHGREATP